MVKSLSYILAVCPKAPLGAKIGADTGWDGPRVNKVNNFTKNILNSSKPKCGVLGASTASC